MCFSGLSSAGTADGKRTGMYSQRVLKSTCKPATRNGFTASLEKPIQTCLLSYIKLMRVGYSRTGRDTDVIDQCLDTFRRLRSETADRKRDGEIDYHADAADTLR